MGLSASAQQDGLGLGVIIGEPTGLSVKKFVGDDAFSAAAAWSVKYDYFYVHLDYLKHNYFLGDQLPVYIGLGGALGFGKDMAVTARVPLGISYLFRGPFDVFFEVVPGLRIIPETDFDVMGAGGFHFYF
ncbi:MAG TPA: hypothetical protein DCG24_06090 [Bacteroidetes bacterium]|nr:hypothetical protein [Bacteroidota bacterium]HAE36185.1 hypothetical protein [Bacteroidota bacterium]